MKHRKLLRSAAVLLTALVWCFSLAGCGFRYVLENDNYAKDEVQRLLTALDRGDQQGFKDLFCEDSVKKINEIDRKIDEFFRFYQGRSVSWEDLGGSSEVRGGISPSAILALWLPARKPTGFYFITPLITRMNRVR